MSKAWSPSPALLPPGNHGARRGMRMHGRAAASGRSVPARVFQRDPGHSRKWRKQNESKDHFCSGLGCQWLWRRASYEPGRQLERSPPRIFALPRRPPKRQESSAGATRSATWSTCLRTKGSRIRKRSAWLTPTPRTPVTPVNSSCCTVPHWTETPLPPRAPFFQATASADKQPRLGW